MTEELPAPLTPPECDLTDFGFMPLMIARLKQSKSWLRAKRNPALGFYLINLWTAAWHQVPAASLEDDDDVLADLAMCEQKTWPKVKAEVLRSWVKCSDGRLYHPVVAAEAIDAWDKKKAQRRRTEAARLVRQNNRRATTDNVTSNTTDNVTHAVTPNVTDNVTASKGQGQGQGQGDKERKMPEPNGSAPISDQDRLWRDAVPYIRNRAGKPESQARSIIGKWAKDHGAARVLEAVAFAQAKEAVEPVAFIAATLGDKSKDDGKFRLTPLGAGG